jgi:hypothetical protein
MMFAHRMHGVMLELGEAVAQHWHDIWWYYCAFAVGSIGFVFLQLAGIAAASGWCSQNCSRNTFVFFIQFSAFSSV